MVLWFDPVNSLHSRPFDVGDKSWPHVKILGAGTSIRKRCPLRCRLACLVMPNGEALVTVHPPWD